MKASRAAILVSALMLAGCAIGPNYKRPEVSVPEAFRNQAAPEKESLADLAWWDLYTDPALKALINEALTGNNDLRAAIARVDRARALAGVAWAGYLPRIGYEGGAQHDRNVFKLNPDLQLPSGDRSSDLFLGGLSAAWELDVWGRIRRLNEAALADYLATEEARRAVMVTVASDVAQAYFELEELDRRLVIAKDSAAGFEETHALFNRRFKAGIASRLEVTRAESALAGAKGNISEIERRIALKENQISILVGKPPGEVKRKLPQGENEEPPGIPAGLPSTLLERRPDVREAEEALVAANARIGVAKSDFFPRIGLTALFGRASTDLSTFTNGPSAVTALAATVTGPIFTGGAVTSEYRAAKADYEQTKYTYLQTVIKAFQEVSDALVSADKLSELEKEQKQVVDSLNESVAIADRRYRGGLASYYEVIEAQQLLYPAEEALSKTRRDRLLTVVQLYKALGGGWKQTDAQFAKGNP